MVSKEKVCTSKSGLEIGATHQAGSFLPQNQALRSSSPRQGFSECKEPLSPLPASPDLGGGRADKLPGDAEAAGPGTQLEESSTGREGGSSGVGWEGG